MKVILVLYALASLTCVSSRQCDLIKQKLSRRAKCVADDVEPCYDLCTKKQIKPKDCSLPENSHCCMKDCTCIMKSDETKMGLIPVNLRIPDDKPLELQFLEGCCEKREDAGVKPLKPSPPPNITCLKLRIRISNLAECLPEQGYEDEVQDCYNLINKKLVDPEDCMKPVNSHCCIYNCRCVVKGAGTKHGAIPAKCMPKPGISKTMGKRRLLRGCIPPPPTCPMKREKQEPKEIPPTKKPKGSDNKEFENKFKSMLSNFGFLFGPSRD